MYTLKSFGLALWIATVLWSGGTPAYAMIYGADDRKEAFEVSADWRRWGRAVALLTDEQSLEPLSETGFRLLGKKSSDYHGFCSDQRFAQQSVFGSCTAFLIGPQLMVTAGHCLAGDRISEPQGYESSEYAHQRIVFGVESLHPEAANRESLYIPKSQIFSIKRVLKQSNVGEYRDFAMIELDRSVHPSVAEPLVLADSESVRESTPVVLIGHPLGLAKKYAGSARIIRSFDQVYSSNLDALTGNSGSPVLDSKTGNVLGILIGTQNGTQNPAFEIREQGDVKCAVYKQAPNQPADPTRGAMIQKISVLSKEQTSPNQILMNEVLMRLEYQRLANENQEQQEKRHDFLKKSIDLDSIVSALDRGASPLQTDIHGYSLLTLAVAHHHYALVDLLLARGADINQMSPDRANPLTVALSERDVTMVRKLVAHRPRLDLRLQGGQTIESWLRTSMRYYLPLFTP